MKIGLVYPDDFSVWIFRKKLILMLKELGHDVYVITSPGEFVEKIESLGAIHVPIGMERFVGVRGDIKLFVELFKLFKRLELDVVHNFTIKPNTYSAIAAKLVGTKKIYNSVTGLGYLYRYPWESSIKEKILKKIIYVLYWIGTRVANKTWFQNVDDVNYFESKGLISNNQIVLIRSSGIDVKEWKIESIEENEQSQYKKSLGFSVNDVVVLMVARALKTKGINEYAEAAKILQAKYKEVKFLLVGGAEEDGNLGLSSDELKNVAANFQWLGHRTDIKQLIAISDICVLPSYYREGVPRSLLEAMALSKPIVTTNSAGCKETIESGVNGFMIEPRNERQLAEAIEKLAIDEELRERMGKNGRSKVESEFSEEYVAKSLITKLYEL